MSKNDNNDKIGLEWPMGWRNDNSEKYYRLSWLFIYSYERKL